MCRFTPTGEMGCNRSRESDMRQSSNPIFFIVMAKVNGALNHQHGETASKAVFPFVKIKSSSQKL